MERSSSLSAREVEILELAACGLRNHGIAAQLNISVHAVKFHLASLYRKLEVGNRTEAAVVYLSSTNRSPLSTTGSALRLEEAQ